MLHDRTQVLELIQEDHPDKIEDDVRTLVVCSISFTKIAHTHTHTGTYGRGVLHSTNR